MAATIARAVGYDKNRTKEVHRLGSETASVTAATWRTFARANVHRDGSGSVTIERDGKVLHSYSFEAE